MTNPVTDAPCCTAKMLYLTAAMSGALLYASFFPLNLGFLAWVALVPVLFLVRSNARPRHVYLAAFVGGLVFYVPAIQWMRVAHPAMYGTWAILSVVCSLYFTLGLWLIRKLDRSAVPLTLAVPTVWVALEYMRAHFPTGFPWLEGTALLNRIGFGWYFLGYTQHDALPVIQIADIAGIYGVSLLVVLVNVVAFLWLSRLVVAAPASRPWLATATAVALVAATLAYGYSRLDHPAFDAGPRVVLLQSNLPQSVKMGSDKVVNEHMAERLRAAELGWGDVPPDLVIWPETTFTMDWCDVAAGLSPEAASSDWQKEMALSRKIAKLLAERWKCNQLLGLNGLEQDAAGQKWKYNSAKLVYGNGAPGPRYDKMHLVPFGEYVPMRNTFPFLKMFTPYKHDYSCKPGEHWTRFPLNVGDKTYHFGCIICYEDTDPALAREYLRPSPEGPAVDFLVNISNDGWFDGTEEHEQHLAICRFRAIECRRSVVRAVNMGISGIIDADGRVVQIPGRTWYAAKKKTAVVNGPVPIDHRESIYARWGDVLPIVCWAGVLTGLLFGCRRNREAV